jgi:hypothetical protein
MLGLYEDGYQGLHLLQIGSLGQGFQRLITGLAGANLQRHQ